MELLSYDPDSGLFTWNQRRGGKALAGSVAGVLRPDGYVTITIDFKKTMAHRLAWLVVHGAEPTDQIDHINGIRSDNRLCNLRAATNGQNQQNLAGAKKQNRLGFLGVTFHPQSGKYRARIRTDGQVKDCGLHATPELAHAAYLAEKIARHTHLDRAGGAR
jgi:hypothetical protein